MVGLIAKCLVCTDDKINTGVIQVYTLGADVFAAFYKTFAGIDELNLAATVQIFAFGQHPDIGGDPGVVEQIGRQLNDGFHQITLDDITADLGCAGTGITCE